MSDENRNEVFKHTAYEAYEDLLVEMAELLSEAGLLADPHRRARWLALDREAWDRACTLVNISTMQKDFAADLQRIGVAPVVLPDDVPHRFWRSVFRQVQGLGRLLSLEAPDIIIDDFRTSLVDSLAELTHAPGEYLPHLMEWKDEVNFVNDSLSVVMIDGDEIGIQEGINRLPEAESFRRMYRGAYSYWDIHSYHVDDYDDDSYEVPEPVRYPGAIWTAYGTTLPSTFAPTYRPPYGGGPVSYGTSKQLIEWIASEYPSEVGDFVRACRSAAIRGRAVVSMIEVCA